ncbi:M13 family metallopeptidase [Sphingomonas sp. LY29]|uniref:M13 family metallopeptidase n=1 Tax=Sphingomonas sp. LY29 TaxID=3095341 RepID=UPI002D791F1A|nr:M13 family metallopeptidase [Sphingomonas sp. LY29]WRP25685.1 M13 family metallopeptidase [Sphingomonas sp. LY29]
MRTKMIATLLGSAALALATAACNTSTAGNEATEQAAPGDKAGIDLAAMDKSVKPGDDFYAYANGGWMRSAQIPADRSSVGGFFIADQQREKNSIELMDGLLKSNAAADTDAGRIANYYKAYLDTAAIDRAGIAPAKADLDAIARIADKRALSAAIGSSLRADTDPLNATNYQTENLFGIFVTQGLTTPGETLPYLMQGGLGLPEREYYLDAAADKAALRTQYKDYVAKVLAAAGNPNAAAAAQRVVDLETKIARAHANRAESEDFAKGSTVWTRAELEAAAPGIDWPALLGAAQLGNAPKFQAYHATAIPRLAALVGSEPLDAWKDWMAFHTLNQRANVLPATFRDASFAFNGTALNGTPQQRPRDKQALNAASAALEGAFGKAYVEKHFPAASKAEIQGMVDNIKNAFAARVRGLDWMAPTTKQEAVKKVETIVVGVGYPDTWPDYSSVTISPTDAYANAKAAELAHYRQQIAKIGKPMDRAEWWMPPQLVNAVNLPVQNALNFPAAILVRPFFDPSADPAYNYGAIGGVIGHEISHSFDNNGALFDSTGRMRNWWTPTDFARFTKSGEALARQYDAYSPFPGVNVNGKLTLGENIADVAGLTAAYEAYRASLGGKELPVLDGLTGDQRFFIANAQAWATKMRDEALKARIATDGHAPGQYRALTVRNLDAWYKAFNVQPGDKLYLKPEDRVKIW